MSQGSRCPECEAEIESDELDEFDVDIGDRLVCTACAATLEVVLEVVEVAPVELAVGSHDATDDVDDGDATVRRVKHWEENGEWDP